MSMLGRNYFNPLEAKQTWLHKLNPALKVGCSLFLLVMIFLPTGALTQLILLIGIICMLASARISKGSILAILKTILFIFIVVFIINWLTAKSPGFVFDLENRRHIWGPSWDQLFNWGWIQRFDWSGIDIYWYHGIIWGGSVGSITPIQPESGQYIHILINNIDLYVSYDAPIYALSSHTLITTISITIKLFMMLSIFSLQVNTTTTLGLSYGVETLLYPLRVIKVPTGSIAIVIAIAIKFVPNLLAQANMIVKAQASRGLDMRNGRIPTKLKALVNLIVPMFSIAFNQADQLADAMEARNYDPRQKRTRYKKYLVRWYEWVFATIIVLLFILLVIMVVYKVVIGPLFLIDIHIV